jgi:hypothetical protein
MERRSFLKGLFGVSTAIAATTILPASANNIISNVESTPLSLKPLYKQFYENISTAVKFNDISIVDKNLLSKVNKVLSFTDEKHTEDLESYFWSKISNMNYFLLANNYYAACNEYGDIKGLLKYKNKFLDSKITDIGFNAYFNSLKCEFSSTCEKLNYSKWHIDFFKNDDIASNVKKFL